MKCKTIVDMGREEEVLIYVHAKNETSQKIETFVNGLSTEIFGYRDKISIKLHPSEIQCFTVREGKTFAMTENETFQLKERLYMLEEMLDDSFLKINQSCIANIHKIKKFDASFSGALFVILQNGYKDYVSRRRLKAVKERIGL